MADPTDDSAGGPSAGLATPTAERSPDTDTEPVDAAWALTRAEADALCGMVTLAPEPHGEPPASSVPPPSAAPALASGRRWSLSPDAMRTGIEALAGTETGGGCVEVLRLPGALRSPEMWQVRLIGVRPEALERVAAAVRRAQGRDEHDVR